MSDSEPPPYGRRLLVVQVDHLAKTTPDKIYASYAKSLDLSQGFRDVTWKHFANAVNRAASWLEKTLGGKSDSFETIAYMGESDLRYFIFILASNKTGYKLLVPSPRNSLEGQLNLIDKTKCRTFLHTKSISVDYLLDERPLRSFAVPSLDELLDPTPVPHVPYDRSFDQAHADPFIVYHSSGSTGLPKPVVSPHGAICTFDAVNTVPPLDGKESYYPYVAKNYPRFFCSLPFFHAAGVLLGFAQPAYFGNSVVFGHPNHPMNSDLVDHMIDHARVDSVILPPSILEEMTKKESSLERLSRLKMVMVGTGPLSNPAGKLAAQKTFLNIAAGSTEAQVWVCHVPDPEDWQYFMINTQAAGMDMRPDPDRGLYEMVYVRRPECDHLQAIFKTYRDLEQYETGDLFEPHPEKKHLWRYVGRRDDMIVLSNGEKVQPGPIQDALSAHQAIRTPLVVGQGKFQIAAILELRHYPKTEQDANELMDGIWKLVEQANKHSPAHGRLLRQFIMFASPDKPFVRVGKGSLSKPSTLDLYAEEIEALFAKGESSMAIDIEPLDVNSETALQQSIASACKTILGRKSYDVDDDFFSAGADSLAVLTLAATLKRGLETTAPAATDGIDSRLIYGQPTVRQMSSAIMALARGENGAPPNSKSDAEDVTKALIDRVIRSASLQEKQNGRSSDADATAVLLTGSTGSLGSYILHQLLSNSTISKVYCFNRSEDGESKQKNSSENRGLSTDFQKVVFVKGDLSKENFDLTPDLYQSMAEEVKYIIHSQWPVNFNLGITTFEPHVQGMANLASFASSAPARPSICFLSSVASVENWTVEHDLSDLVPETPLADVSLASSGYGLSKLAACTVLDQAAKHGVRSLTIRIGQIAGPSDDRNGGAKAVWPKQEWLPSLIASSQYLGVVPQSLEGAEAVDWVPVDRVARAVCELAASPDVSGYAHIVSPKPTTWHDTVLPAVQEYFGGRLKVVSLEEWVARLKESASRANLAETQQNPGLKLVGFFEGLAGGFCLPALATDRARGLSATMRDCGHISRSDMLRWLRAWDF